MEKLVIEYTSGDIVCSCEYIFCCEYESKEKFKDDLETALLQTLEENEKLEKILDAWRASEPTPGRLTKEDYTERRYAWLKSHPGRNTTGEVRLSGIDIPIVEIQNDQVRIYSLDEWFNARRRTT